MNRIGKIIVFFTLSILSLQSFAAEAPLDLEITEYSDSSLMLDWSDVEEVLGYYIYYGTTSGSGASYEVEGVDLIEESEFVLEGLSPETRYYISLTSVDEFGSESVFARELEAQTLALGAESQGGDFKVNNVELIDDTSLEINFSTNLELGDSAQRLFIIENTVSGEEIPVDISEVSDSNNSNAIVILGSPLQADSEYTVTVLDIRDQDGNTIESGINAFVNFTTPQQFVSDLESAGAQQPSPVEEPEVPETIEQETIEETTSVEENQEIKVGNNAGTTISNDVISENTLSAASENKALPQTGPEHWILLFISFLVAGGIYKMNSNNRNS